MQTASKEGERWLSSQKFFRISAISSSFIRRRTTTPPESVRSDATPPSLSRCCWVAPILSPETAGRRRKSWWRSSSPSHLFQSRLCQDCQPNPLSDPTLVSLCCCAVLEQSFWAGHSLVFCSKGWWSALSSYGLSCEENKKTEKSECQGQTTC